MTSKKRKTTKPEALTEILLKTSVKCTDDLLRTLKSWSDPGTAPERIMACAAYLRAVDRICNSLQGVKPYRILRTEAEYYIRGSRRLLRLQEHVIMIRSLDLNSPYADLVASQLGVRAADWITDIQDRLAFLNDEQLRIAAEEGSEKLHCLSMDDAEVNSWFEDEICKLQRRQRKSLVKVQRKTLEKACRHAQTCVLMQKVLTGKLPATPSSKTLAELVRRLEIAAYWRRLEEFVGEFTLHSALKGHKSLKKSVALKADEACAEADEALSGL